jgi:3-hydroxypropanoate dehydrogenase
MVDPNFLDHVFRMGRSQSGWLAEPVSNEQLKQVYELMKWGPTSLNCLPARIVFVRSEAGKAKLKDAFSPGNIEKSMTAPVLAVVGYETRFDDDLPGLFAHKPAVKTWFEGEAKVGVAQTTAFRNGTLQGLYLIAAARAVGLDCGPTSGFDNAKVDAALFAGTSIESNFICGLGRGDPAKLIPRSPRLSFEEACKLI